MELGAALWKGLEAVVLAKTVAKGSLSVRRSPCTRAGSGSSLPCDTT